MEAPTLPWFIDFVAVSNNTDPSSPTYINDYPMGSTRAGVFSPGMPALPEKDLFVVTSFMPNDVKPNVRIYNRNAQLKLTYQTGFRGHQYSFVKTSGPAYILISSIWWSSTSDIMFMRQTLQISAAGDIVSFGGAFIATSDRIVQTVDLPGTKYFFGIGISFVFKFDGVTSNMEAFRSLSGANNYPSYMGPFNNGQSLLVVYAPMKWATFSTLDLTQIATNTVSTNFGTLTIDNLNQMTAFAVVTNPVTLCKRDVSIASFNMLDSISLGSVGLSSVLNMGSFDLVFLLPMTVERMPVNLQNSLMFSKKSSLQLYSYVPPGYVLDNIYSTLMGPSNPTDIDFGMRFYFAFVRDTFFNFQSYYMLMDTCMSLDGLTLSCTKCPAGYWRAGASFAAPRRCLSPQDFPASTGMNNLTNTYETCALGISCKSCIYDYQACSSCDTQASYYLDSTSGLCVLKSNFASRVGVNPWNRRISPCVDTNCLDCRENIYLCQVCDTAAGFYLNQTITNCQHPTTFAPGFGVSLATSTIAPCVDTNCLSCAVNAAVCSQCNIQNYWYLNSTSGGCQSPPTFLQGFGVGVWSNLIESCQDPNCLDCRANSQQCVQCNQLSGYYLNTSSQTCMLPVNFASGYGAVTSTMTIQSCRDAQCLDCRMDYQVCSMCNILADWYLNTTSGLCQQPSTFSNGYGVNTTSRLIQTCSDPNCLDCKVNNRMCYACITSSLHYWDSASLRCLNTTEFPKYFGLELTNMIVGRCADQNCLECPTSTTVCSKCDTLIGRYLAPGDGTCITLSQFLPRNGVDLSSGKMVPCAHPNCLACTNDYTKCTQCDVSSQYYLNQTRMSCQQPSEFDLGFGIDATTHQIAKCVDRNCMQCSSNIQVCQICNTKSGWYLNTTTSTCQSPADFASGFGVDDTRRTTPVIRACRQAYCFDCSLNVLSCQKCDVSNNYYLNSTDKTCQTPQTFASGFGVNKFSQMIDLCVDPHCSDCHLDTKVCTWCKLQTGWYLNTGSGVCLQPNEFPAGFGVNLAKNTLENCIDAFCLECQPNTKKCRKCDTDKNYFLNDSREECQTPQNFDAGFGVDLLLRKIKPCVDSNCIDCSSNYESCRKCDTSRQFFLHSSGSCLQVTTTTPLIRAGANLLSGKIEPCADPSCDSCVLDSRICSGCDFLNGFKLEGDVCVQSSSEKPKLRVALSKRSERRVLFEFYEPVQVSNLTNFFQAFKVYLTDRVKGIQYTCSDTVEDLSRNIVLCAVDRSSGFLEIAILSEVDMLAARMTIEDPNRVGLVPNGTIVGEQSKKLFTDYPLSALHVVTSELATTEIVGTALNEVYNFRSVLTAVLYLFSPRLGIWVERGLSNINYLGYLEGKTVTYPDLLFSQYVLPARIGGTSNDWGLWNSDWDHSRCQTNPTLWRRSVKCSVFSNLNSEIFFVTGLVFLGGIIYAAYVSLASNLENKSSNSKIHPLQSKAQISSRHEQNLLMSERAEASPSIDDSQKENTVRNIEQDASPENRSDEFQCAQKKSQEKNYPAEDEFEDLPIEQGAGVAESGAQQPNAKDFHMKVPQPHDIAVRSENTPLEWGESENQFRDVRSAGLPKLRRIKPVTQANFGSRSSVVAASPSFQQSMFSLDQTPARTPKRYPVAEFPGCPVPEYQGDEESVHTPPKMEKPVAKILEPKQVLLVKPVARKDNRSSRLSRFLWTNGLQFVFAKFEATQLDYIFLSMVNLYYYSEGIWEIGGFVLSLLILSFYAWVARKAWMLFMHFETQNKQGTDESCDQLLNDNTRATPVSLGYYFGAPRKFTSSLFVLMPLANVIRCSILARILVAMFELPIFQASLVILTEVAYTIYVWKFNSSPYNSELTVTNFVNITRVIYLCFKLVLETNLTSELTNQTIIGYCMSSLVTAMVAIVLALPIYIVCCEVWRGCLASRKQAATSSNDLPPANPKLPPAPETKSKQPFSGQDVELKIQADSPTKNAANEGQQQLAQQQEAEHKEPAKAPVPEEADQMDLARLPTLKKQRDIPRRTIEAQPALHVVVRPPPGKVEEEPAAKQRV